MHETLLTAFGVTVASWAIPILLGLLSVLGLKYLSANKDDVAYAQIALSLAKQILGTKLGDKADFIYSIWLEGLNEIASGKFTDNEAVDVFVKFVQKAAADHNVTLTDTEIEDIKQVTLTIVNMLHLKNQPTTKAVKMMMVLK